jgi:hypothetical protein
MGMDGVWEWRRMERIQYQHADAKMQMRGWMNAVYGNAARLIFRRTSEKTRCPGGRKCGVCQRMPKCASTVQYGPLALGAPKNATDVPPTIERRRGGCARGCTSLPCTSGTVRMPCPVKTRVTGIREQNENGTE